MCCCVAGSKGAAGSPPTHTLHHSTTTPLHSHHQRCLRLVQGVKPAGDKPLAAHRDGSSRGIRPRSIRCNTPPPPLPPAWLRLRLRLCHRRLFRHALASDTASIALFLYLFSFSPFNKVTHLLTLTLNCWKTSMAAPDIWCMAVSTSLLRSRHSVV